MYNNIGITDSDIYKGSSNSPQDLQKNLEQQDIEQFVADTDNNSVVPSSAKPAEASVKMTLEAEHADENIGNVTEEIASDASEKGYLPMPDNRVMELVGFGAASRQSCRGIHKETEDTFYNKIGSDDVEQVLMYMRCLEKELEGKEFQIKSSKKIGDVVWRFEVIIDSEPVNYLGQGGEIWIETIEESSL